MSLLAAFFEELSGRGFGWEAYRNQPWMVLMDNQLIMLVCYFDLYNLLLLFCTSRYVHLVFMILLVY